MSDETIERAIDADKIILAFNLIVFDHGADIVQAPAGKCDWPKVCGDACKFPRYTTNGEWDGLTAKILLKLGYPQNLLHELDREHETGEVLHPGVKIGHSRNPALARIDVKGMALLAFLQRRERTGKSWGELSIAALGRKKLLRFADRRRRPWLY